MIWMLYCPKCGAPLRCVTTGWSCTNLNCGCQLDAYGNQYINTVYTYEVNENPKEVRQWM